MKLTDLQQAAISCLIHDYGESWRAALRSLWTRGADDRHSHGAALRQLRNQFGPEWLDAYRPGDTQVGWLQRSQMEAGTGAPGFRWVSCWKIVNENGIDMVQPYDRTKNLARETARRLHITLLEER